MSIEVRADMMANVWAVAVAVGDEVESGDVVVILESMKMEIPVTAPASGTVSSVLVSPQDSVQQGEVLVELS